MSNRDELSFFDSADDAADDGRRGGSTRVTSAQYLVFVVAKVELAVALANVSEIVPYEAVSALPGTPSYVRGVVHVRGRVIPVIDLATKLGRVSDPVTKRSCILMLDLKFHGESLLVGVAMDGIATLLDLDPTLIRAAPRFGTSVEVRYLSGLIPTERGMLPLIDFCRLFADDELTAVVEVVSDAADERT